MKINYVAKHITGVIIAGCQGDDPDAGPAYPLPACPEGCQWIEVGEPFTRAGRADSEEARLVDGAVVWVETAALADVIEQVLDQIDADADTARVSVLIKTTKAEEYMQAETQARAWQEADYAGDAPPDVASWAAAKWRDKLTDQQAAESILAQADQYRALLSGIRALRLRHMEDARHAADAAGARAVLSTFTTELSNLMKGTA